MFTLGTIWNIQVQCAAKTFSLGALHQVVHKLPLVSKRLMLPSPTICKHTIQEPRKDFCELFYCWNSMTLWSHLTFHWYETVYVKTYMHFSCIKSVNSLKSQKKWEVPFNKICIEYGVFKSFWYNQILYISQQGNITWSFHIIWI